MLAKIVFLAVCVFLTTTVYSRSLEKVEDNNEQKDEILSSLVEFVNMVNRYKLNVSVIASKREYASGGWVKEDMSVTIHMPVYNEHLTEATMDDSKQDKYVKKLKKYAKKENVGVTTRVIKIENGVDKLTDIQTYNEKHLVTSPGYKSLTSYKNGVQGFSLSDNDTYQILYNYIVKDTAEKIQVITAQVVINEIHVTEDFPPEVLQEIKRFLPQLYMGIDNNSLLARLLVQHLDKKFEGNHQAIVDVENFSLNGKQFANLKIADTNIVVFLL